MEELVFKSEKGTPVTNSLLVAQKFGKRHADVIRAIRELISKLPDNQCERNFAQIENRKIEQPLGGFREEPVYLMTRDGFVLLIFGFTGKDALQFKLDYINAFNQMEAHIKSGSGFAIPQNFAEALRLAAEQQEQIEAKQKQLELQAPKVLFADAVATSDRSVLVSELAKVLKQNGIEIGQNRLFIWLRENGYLCSKGEYYNQPTQKAMEMGLFELKKTSITKPDGTVFVTVTTKVTGKGQIYFVNKFLYKQEREKKGGML